MSEPGHLIFTRTTRSSIRVKPCSAFTAPAGFFDHHVGQRSTRPPSWSRGLLCHRRVRSFRTSRTYSRQLRKTFRKALEKPLVTPDMWHANARWFGEVLPTVALTPAE